MTRPWLLIMVVVAVGLLYVVLPVVADIYRRFRGTFRVTCPETRDPACVRVDTERAALTGAFGDPDLRLADCSRWPERQDCDQGCLEQVR